MHIVAYAVVSASSKEEALSRAHEVFETLIDAESNLIDYFVTFDEDGQRAAGRARFGDMPVAARVDSPEGDALASRGWTETNDTDKVTFQRDEDSDENGCVMFDADANPILERSQLDALLERDDTWIVPVDAHF